MDTIMVCAGDGFCGGPTSLRLAKYGFKVAILDNLSRRYIDDNISFQSLTKIAHIANRGKKANELIGEISFQYCDIGKDPIKLHTPRRKYNLNQ